MFHCNLLVAKCDQCEPFISLSFLPHKVSCDQLRSQLWLNNNIHSGVNICGLLSTNKIREIVHIYAYTRCFVLHDLGTT